MNRRVIYSLIAAAIPTVALCADEVKPNILWVITDDHRADALACWNRATTSKSESALGYVSSPNLDRLAGEGVLFTNAFCNSPVSAPSRASMHTGRYPHHSGIYDFSLSHSENDNAKPIMPAVLREEGYRATLFGKLGVRIFEHNTPMSFTDNPDIYNERVSMEKDLERSGVTDWCQVGVSGNDVEIPGRTESWYYPDGSSVSYFMKYDDPNIEVSEEDLKKAELVTQQQHIIRVPNKKNYNGEILSGENTMPTDKTLDGRISQEFITYLENEDRSYNILNGREVEGPKSGQPQFINLGFHFPHTAIMPSKEYRDQFLNRRYNIPVFDAEEESRIPKQLDQWRANFDITSLSEADKEQFIRDYYAFCAMGDQLLGQSVDKFIEYCDKRGEPYLIVIACGDHGWHLGEQGVIWKGSNYVKSNQTAVIAISSDKSKFPAGKVVSDLVEYVDFAPTFLEAAGVDITADRFDYLDGRPLTATASCSVTPRDYVLGETSVSGGHRAYLRGKEFAFSMRSKKPNTTYDFTPDDAKWPLTAPIEEVDLALFDLRVDPGENRNVAYDKEYRELAEWMRQKLGNIVLGDNRQECDWDHINRYTISNFAPNSDDKRLDIPSEIIPEI